MGTFYAVTPNNSKQWTQSCSNRLNTPMRIPWINYQTESIWMGLLVAASLEESLHVTMVGKSENPSGKDFTFSTFSFQNHLPTYKSCMQQTTSVYATLLLLSYSCFGGDFLHLRLELVDDGSHPHDGGRGESSFTTKVSIFRQRQVYLNRLIELDGSKRTGTIDVWR